MNRTPMWGLAPDGLTQSYIGIQIKEPVAAGWTFVAQIGAGFDLFALQFVNSPGSESNNVGVPVKQQTVNGDASRAGQFYNSSGFLGRCARFVCDFGRELRCPRRRPFGPGSD